MNRPVHELSVREIGSALRDGRLRSTDLTRHMLGRIADLDGRLKAFILVTADRALEDARRADDELARGIDRGALHGVPYALKDIYDTAGIPTTCNSRLRWNFVPDMDSEAERRLRQAGGVLLGKLNTHEFAIGGPGFDLPVPPARNPWNTACFTGGSSSGSGAAVAADLVRIALGSDTGGSTRSPAALCGVVGLKPTYGLVSRRGMFPLSYSLDHAGLLGRSVDDVALTLNVVAGHDPEDPSSAQVTPVDYASGLGQGLQGLRVAYARDLFSGVRGLSPEVPDAIDAAARALVELGATVEEVQLPDFDLFKACGRIIMCVEAFAIHESDLRTRGEEFGRYTFQRIAPAGTLSGADLVQAFRLRRELTLAVDAVFASHDVILTACAIGPAASLEDFPLDWPPPSAAVAVQTVPFNVSGHPALALPACFFANGMPLGLQLVGRAFDEKTLLRVGAAFEAHARVGDRRPVFVSS